MHGTLSASPALVYLFCFALYLWTSPPTIYSMDSGEFAAAAFLLAPAHAPGYPLYVLLAKLGSLLPVSKTAFGLNLLSALWGALAAATMVLLARLVLGARLLAPERFLAKPHQAAWEKLPAREEARRWAPVLAGLLLGLGTTFWYQSYVAEQYTLHAFTFLAVVGGLVAWSQRGDVRLLYFAALMAGLAVSAHPLVLTYASLLFFFLLFLDGRILLSRHLAVMGFFFLLGLSTYLALPLRSAAEPLINWGQPETWRQFLYVVTLEESKEMFPAIARLLPQWRIYRFLGGGLWQNIYLLAPFLLLLLLRSRRLDGRRVLGIFAPVFTALFLLTYTILPRLDPAMLHRYPPIFLFDLLIGQTTFFVFWLAVPGAWRMSRERPLLFILFFYLLILAFPYNTAINFPHNNPVLQERHRIAGYIPLALFCAYGFLPFLTVGLSALQRAGRRRWTPAAAMVPALFPLAFHLPALDRHDARYVEDYARDLLDPLPQETLFIARRTENVFPLWYVQIVEGYRRDVRLVYAEALSNPWYLNQLRRRHPELLPEIPPMPQGKKWEHTTYLERGEYTDDLIGRIVERQVSHAPVAYATGIEPFVPESLGRWAVVPEGLHFRIYPPEEVPEARQLKANYARYRNIPGVIKHAKDDWIARVIAGAYANLMFYLAEEGIAGKNLKEAERWLEKTLQWNPDHLMALSKLATMRNEDLDTDRALALWEQAYLREPKSCYIINNLAATYERKGVETKDEALAAKAVALYEEALDYCPLYENVIYNLAMAYERRGQKMRARRLLEEALKNLAKPLEIAIELARMEAEGGRVGEAEKVLERGLQKHPEGLPLYVALASLLGQQKRTEEGLQVLERYRRLFPEDPYIEEAISDYRAAALGGPPRLPPEEE